LAVERPGTDLVFFLTDLADHYSQIANYMRLMGMIALFGAVTPRSLKPGAPHG
jgi:hypothetical protein